MAKLHGNKSAAFYQLALRAESEGASSQVTSEFLQNALNDGLKAVELDAAYEKGHFRLLSHNVLLYVILDSVRLMIGDCAELSQVALLGEMNYCSSRCMVYLGGSQLGSRPSHPDSK